MLKTGFVTLTMNYGKRNVPAFCGSFYAVHKARVTFASYAPGHHGPGDMQSRLWTVTHIASGLQLPGIRFNTRAYAVKLAADLDVAFPFTAADIKTLGKRKNRDSPIVTQFKAKLLEYVRAE